MGQWCWGEEVRGQWDKAGLGRRQKPRVRSHSVGHANQNLLGLGTHAAVRRSRRECCPHGVQQIWREKPVPLR